MTRSHAKKNRWSESEILDELQNQQDGFQRWAGKNPFTMAKKEFEDFQRDYKEYTRIIRRAIKRGLNDNPIVQAWLAGRRSLGEKDTVSNLHVAGLQVHVSRPMDEPDLWIAVHAPDLIGRMSLEQMRRHLLNLLKKPIEPHFTADVDKFREKVTKRLGTTQNLHQRLDQLGIHQEEGIS